MGSKYFDSAEIAYYRKHIKSIIQTAGSYNCWKKKDPGYLMDEFRLLESIINAAYLLNQQKKTIPFVSIRRMCLIPISPWDGMVVWIHGIFFPDP